MGQKIRLNEVQLKKIIAESVKKTLNEEKLKWIVPENISPENIIDEVLGEIQSNENGLFSKEQLIDAMQKALEYQQETIDKLQQIIKNRDESERLLNKINHRPTGFERW